MTTRNNNHSPHQAKAPNHQEVINHLIILQNQVIDKKEKGRKIEIAKNQENNEEAINKVPEVIEEKRNIKMKENEAGRKIESKGTDLETEAVEKREDIDLIEND